MASQSGALTGTEASRAFQIVSQWRADPDAVHDCPRCGHPGIAITDRSARPYAEWYVLACARCGLDAPLHVALPPPPA